MADLQLWLSAENWRYSQSPEQREAEIQQVKEALEAMKEPKEARLL